MKRSAAFLLSSSLFGAPLLADAHVGISSGPGFANTTQEISFGVGHGCEGADTYAVRIEIPAAVTTVRALTSDFGRATVEKNEAGSVIAVSWQKPVEDVIDGDDNYYKLTLRLRVPNQPFTTLYFPTYQTCRTKDGQETTVGWISTTPGASDEPAPELKILPARKPGWNKVTVPVAISDLSAFFSDAAIVWKDSAAYSSNPDTAAQIAGTEGVTALTSLAAGDVIWVKY